MFNQTIFKYVLQAKLVSKSHMGIPGIMKKRFFLYKPDAFPSPSCHQTSSVKRPKVTVCSNMKIVTSPDSYSPGLHQLTAIHQITKITPLRSNLIDTLLKPLNPHMCGH